MVAKLTDCSLENGMSGRPGRAVFLLDGLESDLTLLAEQLKKNSGYKSMVIDGPILGFNSSEMNVAFPLNSNGSKDTNGYIAQTASAIFGAAKKVADNKRWDRILHIPFLEFSAPVVTQQGQQLRINCDVSLKGKSSAPAEVKAGLLKLGGLIAQMMTNKAIDYLSPRWNLSLATVEDTSPKQTKFDTYKPIQFDIGFIESQNGNMCLPNSAQCIKLQEEIKKLLEVTLGTAVSKRAPSK